MQTTYADSKSGISQPYDIVCHEVKVSMTYISLSVILLCILKAVRWINIIKVTFG